MTRIGTGYPDREKKDQDKWNRGNLWGHEQLVLLQTNHESRYMMPCSQGREGNIFRWWKLRGEDEL
jgi:hypothetical protein